MSHMYPKHFPRENESGGERKVFDFFKEKGNTDWYILHSFHLPKHHHVVFGESDFIVVAPGYGIFTLEIKSGGVGFDGTNWLFINREGKITAKPRGPFLQAYEGMYEIEKIIKEKSHGKYNIKDYMYGFGVIFTDEDDFNMKDVPEYEPWRLMQRRDVMNYELFVKKLTDNFKKELTELGKKIPQPITKEEALEIVNYLRPEIECVAPLKSFVEYSEEDLFKLTDEQFICLDDIGANDRMVVLGGAGTGKTILARKDAENSLNAGEKVAVFCYNKNLARDIRRSLPPEIDVFHFHSFLYKICKEKFNDDVNDNYYSEVLPQKAIEELSINPIKYTKIIIDEFQDLCTQNYLKVINELLENGLFDGKFTFYGDFAQQAIFVNDVNLKLLDNYAYYAKKKLSINCRNTKNIGNEMVNVTGYSDSRYLLKVDGEPVEYFTWTNREEEIQQLKKVLRFLKSKGFKSEEVVILSLVKRNNSIVGEIDPDKFLFGNIDEDPKSYQALFSTVQAFKGLESKVVILTDVDNYDNTQLMYVGLSRARSKMYILECEKASKQRKAGLCGR